MSYLVLARKYRPNSFAEVAGQDACTRTLQGAITEQRIGHAYLFTGPRGTGKTTSARLFAKALNCEQGPAVEPCGTCERCLALDAGSDVDVIEIDGASNTGIDDVRQLRSQTAFAPMCARFKVYIIDEVHMLSKQAFNGLLKTLEEPPSHVKFLFATTELHKVPDTIQSRCQILRLSPLPEATIAAKLVEIFAAEKVTAGEGVVEELARRARGGMRDALSLADQLLAAVGSSPSLEDCERLATEGSAASMSAVVDRILESDPAGMLAALPGEAGSEAEFLGGLLDHLRACLLAALLGEGAPVMPPGAEDIALRAELATRGRTIGARRLELWLQELLHARERLRLLPSHGRLILEVTLLDLCRPEASLGLDEIATRLEALESKVGGVAPQGDPATRAAYPTQAPVPASEPAPPRDEMRPAPPPKAAEEPAEEPAATRPRVRTSSVADAWAGFLAELASASSSLHEVIERRGRLAEYQGGRATIKLSGLHENERLLMDERRNQRTCSRAFGVAVGREVEVVFEDTATARHGSKDPFTTEVSDLFQGRIED
jgi:DNA polymerase III subunit gamma/tau